MINEAFANGLSVQAETSFNAASAATIYNVAGKVGFSFTPILEGGGAKVDVWRHQTTAAFQLKHYRGALNAELGANLLTKHLLDAFFEPIDTTALGGGINQYRYRPRRVATFGSVKFGIDYQPTGPFYALHGAVIDSIAIELRAKQLARLSVAWKAARLETLGAAFGAGATAVDQRTLDGINFALSVDGDALPYALDFSAKFSQEKEPASFGPDKLPTRFRDQKPFVFAGDVAEYVNTTSGLRALTDALGEAEVEATFTDRDNAARKLQVAWPRASFQPHTRDAVSRQDTIDRVQFIGLQDSDLDTLSEPVIILCV